MIHTTIKSWKRAKLLKESKISNINENREDYSRTVIKQSIAIIINEFDVNGGNGETYEENENDREQYPNIEWSDGECIPDTFINFSLDNFTIKEQRILKYVIDNYNDNSKKIIDNTFNENGLSIESLDEDEMIIHITGSMRGSDKSIKDAILSFYDNKDDTIKKLVA